MQFFIFFCPESMIFPIVGLTDVLFLLATIAQ